jgi:hypothetical protein
VTRGENRVGGAAELARRVLVAADEDDQRQRVEVLGVAVIGSREGAVFSTRGQHEPLTASSIPSHDSRAALSGGRRAISSRSSPRRRGAENRSDCHGLLAAVNRRASGANPLPGARPRWRRLALLDRTKLFDL